MTSFWRSRLDFHLGPFLLLWPVTRQIWFHFNKSNTLSCMLLKKKICTETEYTAPRLKPGLVRGWNFRKWCTSRGQQNNLSAATCCAGSQTSKSPLTHTGLRRCGLLLAMGQWWEMRPSVLFRGSKPTFVDVLTDVCLSCLVFSSPSQNSWLSKCQNTNFLRYLAWNWPCTYPGENLCMICKSAGIISYKQVRFYFTEESFDRASKLPFNLLVSHSLNEVLSLSLWLCLPLLVWVEQLLPLKVAEKSLSSTGIHNIKLSQLYNLPLYNFGSNKIVQKPSFSIIL